MDTQQIHLECGDKYEDDRAELGPEPQWAPTSDGGGHRTRNLDDEKVAAT